MILGCAGAKTAIFDEAEVTFGFSAMDIPSKQVFDVLAAAGVHHLHHANSVATACQFIRQQALLSRGTVERLGIAQTPQSSDNIDKRYGIWFDVFLDSVDIHQRARRANVYGPVLFVLDAELIKRTYTGRLWVTKLNPTDWQGKLDRERWFQGKTDLEENLVRGRFEQMVLARHCGGELPFKRYLTKILLDDPERETPDGTDLYSMAVGALHLAMEDAGIDVPLEKRVCRPGCQCLTYWGHDDERLYKMFDPKQ